MDMRKDHQRLLDNLKLIQKTYSVKELSEAIGVSKTTWVARMKEPWRMFSYDDFRLIATFCGINFTEILDGEIRLKGD